MGEREAVYWKHPKSFSDSSQTVQTFLLLVIKFGICLNQLWNTMLVHAIQYILSWSYQVKIHQTTVQRVGNILRHPPIYLNKLWNTPSCYLLHKRRPGFENLLHNAKIFFFFWQLKLFAVRWKSIAGFACLLLCFGWILEGFRRKLFFGAKLMRRRVSFLRMLNFGRNHHFNQVKVGFN